MSNILPKSSHARKKPPPSQMSPVWKCCPGDILSSDNVLRGTISPLRTSPRNIPWGQYELSKHLPGGLYSGSPLPWRCPHYIPNIVLHLETSTPPKNKQKKTPNNKQKNHAHTHRHTHTKKNPPLLRVCVCVSKSIHA